MGTGKEVSYYINHDTEIQTLLVYRVLVVLSAEIFVWSHSQYNFDNKNAYQVILLSL